MTQVAGRIYHVIHPKDPERVRYVGKTKRTIHERETGHWSDCNRKRSNSRMQNWLIKYRSDRGLIEFREVMTASTAEELNTLEMSEIARLRAIGQADLNILDGGDGGAGTVWTPERRARLSATLSGVGAWKARLTWELVREVRNRYLAGENWTGFFEEYGVARSTMSKVIRNITWVDPNYEPPTREDINARRVNVTNATVTYAQVRELRERAQVERKTFKEWAEEFNIRYGTVRTILAGTSFPDPEFDPEKVIRVAPKRPLRKLNEDAVREIRRLRGVETKRVLADRYGVAESTIKGIWGYRTWKDC